MVIEPETSPLVTGQYVVYNAIVSVVTFPMLAGQSVTFGAHEVIVYVLVAYTVEIVYSVADGVGVDVGTGLIVLAAIVTGQTVVYRLITSVVTWPIMAGQFVILAAHDVMV